MDQRVVVVTGAGGPAGQAVVRRLAAAGDTVVAVDARPQPEIAGAEQFVADLLQPHAVGDLARDIAVKYGRVDGVVHLVGGWRGGKTFADTDLEDWDLLHDLLIRTLQLVSLAFEPLLAESRNGRFVIVSATAAQRPGQGDAAYAAAKAAAEAWTLALADALRGTGSAATILVVKALVNDAMRSAKPDAKFTGFTDVESLAEVIAGLWDRPAEELNGQRLELTR
ncbi:NAD(P)-dependent dehydrogenase (short-subunit alcohol dehydrogenase family) [Thermocatellispora tengchongensis]|uniref:NAD(P)-dependent dehydrogenase (Short-subunit alcohol dehydrogenase family) n=1 Tax=Thermocatellispora tengchongensis TaxID=1073253 RepID=A0A840P2U0_9ACTN|nr:SDR family NAD(P)-dependent oxidoreductase [Thermocatellispora tengchongensis]MBB5132816.1 NAD(P)-dependent dehydrogenase (short-subunit alcohol dehydrogenase family) [Thermocatellispora tengchongensis]